MTLALDVSVHTGWMKRMGGGRGGGGVVWGVGGGGWGWGAGGGLRGWMVC